MFFKSDRGGETAATLMSVFAGAKRHGIEPFAYVRQSLIALSSADVDLRSLLPDIWIAAHPDTCCSTAVMRRRRPPVRGSGGARNAGPSRKSGSPRVEVVNRPGLIGRLDQRKLRLLTGQWS